MRAATPLDLDRFNSIDGGDGDGILARTALSDDEVAAILAEGRLVMLTDQYAPVDQMLAPVARGEEARPDTPEPESSKTKAE